MSISYKMDSALIVKGLSKQFYRYYADRPWTLHETLVRGLRRLQPFEGFWALRDVSFSVAPGRMVGLIGSNGSGKSTLLRLIGGVGRPDGVGSAGMSWRRQPLDLISQQLRAA